MLEKTASEDAEWVSLPRASARLGFSVPVLLRLIESGDLPALTISNAERTAHRLPAALVEEARGIVFGGGQVDLRKFGRQWKAQNLSTGAVALCPTSHP